MSVITIEKDKVIEMVLSDIPIAEIARKINVSRTTIYSWLKENEVKAELEAREQQRKKFGNSKVIRFLPTALDNMIDLANNSTDVRVKFQANKYLIDQGLGSPSAAKEDSNTNSTGKENIDSNTLKAELEDIKNLKVVK